MRRIILFLAFLFPCFLLHSDLKQLSSKVVATLTEHGSENASDIYQKLGNEAQRLVEITCIHPIKKMAEHSPLYHSSLGCCSNGIIFVKELKNPINSRLTLIHETIHLKQFNGKFFEVINKDNYKSFEEEANLEAAVLGHCWCCSAYAALSSYSIHNNSLQAHQSREKGYPPCETYHKIVLEQFKNDAYCTHHTDASTSYKYALLTLLQRKSKVAVEKN